MSLAMQWRDLITDTQRTVDQMAGMTDAYLTQILGYSDDPPTYTPIEGGDPLPWPVGSGNEGMSEVEVFRAIQFDWAKMIQVILGQATQSPASNFLFHSNPITGPN
jgi:hypothetical protein